MSGKRIVSISYVGNLHVLQIVVMSGKPARIPLDIGWDYLLGLFLWLEKGYIGLL